MSYAERFRDYETIRRASYNEVLRNPDWAKRLPDGLVVEVLNKECVHAASKWAGYSNRINWFGVLDARNNAQPRHFHVSFFLSDELAGLAFGRVSKGKNIVRIDYLQRNPKFEELQGIFLPLLLDIAITYAAKIGSKCIKITNPNSDLVGNLINRFVEAEYRHSGPSFPYDHVHFDI